MPAGAPAVPAFMPVIRKPDPDSTPSNLIKPELTFIKCYDMIPGQANFLREDLYEEGACKMVQSRAGIRLYPH
jgi:hypothetical protein